MSLAAFPAAQANELVEAGELEIKLERADSDPQENTPSYQNEWKTFKRPLDEAGIRYRQTIFALESMGEAGYHLSEFTLSFIKDMATVVSAALVAWITSKYGRKVRVKYSDIEVEASSVEEVEKLIDKLVDFKAHDLKKD